MENAFTSQFQFVVGCGSYPQVLGRCVTLIDYLLDGEVPGMEPRPLTYKAYPLLLEPYLALQLYIILGLYG